jgi:hypothetical protein
VPKGGLDLPSSNSSFIAFSLHFRRFYQPEDSSTESTKLINLPQNGTNWALIFVS